MKPGTLTTLADREQRLACKLLLPTLFILLLTAGYPLGKVALSSLTDNTFASDKPTSYVGLANYRKLLKLTLRELPPVLDKDTGLPRLNARTGEPMYERASRVLPRRPERFREAFQFDFMGRRYVLGATSPDFLKAVGNTVAFTVVAVFLETVLGLGIALMVNTRFTGQGTMRAVMLVPWAVITVVSARIWGFMLGPNRSGFFNTLLHATGLGDGNISFLTDPSWQIPAMIAVDVWKTTSFMALLLLAGLQLIPGDLYKAAAVDGASKVRRFFSITLPLLRPTLAVALVFRTLDSMRVFDVFQVLLGTRAYSMASYNYELLISYRDMGLASAVGVIIFLIISMFAIGYMQLLGVGEK